MALNCNISFDNVKYKTPYTAIITGKSAAYGSVPNFELEYSGADLIQKKGYIPKEVLPLLKEDLNSILEYGPFTTANKNKFKKTKVLAYSIENGKAYRNKDKDDLFFIQIEM